MVPCHCCGNMVEPGVPCPVDGNVTAADVVVKAPPVEEKPKPKRKRAPKFITSAAELEAEFAADAPAMAGLPVADYSEGD